MKAATALINLDALTHNIHKIRAIVTSAQVWAMVKANGYGHGMLPVAKHISPLVDGFGVARLDEAMKLREAGERNAILLLEGFYNPSDLPILVESDLQTAIHTFEQIEAIEQANLIVPLRVWLKIDTGMHRIGIRPEQVDEAIKRLTQCKNVEKPLNFMSHFGCADELDNPITQSQLSTFETLTKAHPSGLKTIAASSGCFYWPQSYFDVVRPGIALYGISPAEYRNGQSHDLLPVMTMTSSLIAVRDGKKGEPVGYGAKWVAEKDTKLGVVAIGYGDGYPRTAPNGTPVLINGRIVPIVGRVSMDMLTVDLGSDAIDKVGDEVILWGEDLPVEEVARHVGTIGYELVTNITSRVELIYSDKK